MVPQQALDALMRLRLAPQRMAVIHAIWRLTYGWQHDHAAISAGAITRLTGIDRRDVQKALRWLRARNMVQRDRVRDGRTAVLRFVEHPDEWKVWGNDDGSTAVIKSTHLREYDRHTCGSMAVITGGSTPAPLKIKDTLKDNGANGSKNGNGSADRALAAWLARGGDPREKGLEGEELARLRPHINQALHDMAREAGRT